jgi:hypothetical protein
VAFAFHESQKYFKGLRRDGNRLSGPLQDSLGSIELEWAEFVNTPVQQQITLSYKLLREFSALLKL